MSEVMLADRLHDDVAFQNFVRDFRAHLRDTVMPGTRQVFDEVVEPEFQKENDRSFSDYHEIRRAMTKNPYYQFWSSMQRCSQELMWESVIAPTERNLDDMISRCDEMASKNPAGGSLRLDPDLDMPKYHTAVDIHIQPGGYHTEFSQNDVAAGAIYLAGFPIYIGDELGPESDGIGRALLNYYKQNFADEVPSSILDMGCAVGNSAIPWARAYPDAMLHAIDVAAPCLRFAHARSEAMGETVHYSQQNAERTDFDDESFDLVISHIMLHETSKPALKNIIAETYRLLRPGGVMLHLDVPRGNNEFAKFMSQWETYNNNEVFSAYMTEVDLPSVAQSVGFDADKTFMAGAIHGEEGVSHSYSADAFAWPVLVGRK
jgi:ubiquinone/menaquinone biosynthesis C-methylase UbiE